MSTHPMLRHLERAEVARPYGFVRKIAPGLVEATGPASALGELCDIECQGAGREGGRRSILAEIAAVDETGVVLIPLEEQGPISPDSRVVARPMRDRVPVGDAFAGRAVDALGRPIDAGGAIAADDHMPIAGTVPAPLERADPSHVLATGLRAVDGLLTLGEGQRIGIFAASGVGKTSLVEQLASQVECDRCIICLVGERGREVESLWRVLSRRDDSGRYTLVAATSDESAALRARSAGYALCLAEHWRAKGEHVLFMLDSVTRLAMALREIGLAAGAPPTVRAYTPNVFSALPRLVERCGATRSAGSITAIVTVLSETDDVDDPIVELMKSLLDGHIVLSRSLAEQAHFPAIDVVRSVSRGADRLVSAEQAESMKEAIAMLSAYEDARIMIETGVYKSGTNAVVDRGIAARSGLTAFLQQSRSETVPFEDSVQALVALVRGGRSMRLKGKLEIAAGLIDVLRARRRAAEAALLSARSAERAALEAEQAARAGSRAAYDDWLDHLSRPGFSPELSRSLSLWLIDRESEAEAAALRLRIAADIYGRRQRDWQLLEAQTRSGQKSLRAYERKMRRRREEDRLSRTADLTTYAWSRP